MNTEKYQQWLADFKQLRLPDYQQFPDLALYMDQVIQETNRYLTPILHAEVTKTMINSYVKMGLVPHPLKKKYTAEHLALIMMISVLKPALVWTPSNRYWQPTRSKTTSTNSSAFSITKSNTSTKPSNLSHL